MQGTVTVTVTDDDFGLSVSPPPNITIAEGESEEFTVSLPPSASGDVMVDIVSSEGNSSELNFLPQLTFTQQGSGESGRECNGNR